MKNILAVMVLGMSAASANALACTTITSLPITISAEGRYCLDSDKSVNMGAGNAITINASNVEVDLQGWTITNIAPPSNYAYGVYVGPGPDTVENTVVKNGRLVNFYRGAMQYKSKYGLIDGMDINANNYGIYITAMYQRVTNNSITVDPTGALSSEAVGIHLGSSYITIKNNELTFPVYSTYMRGINGGSQDVAVEDNLFRLPCSQFTTNCVGADNPTGGSSVYANNRFFGVYKGLVLGSKTGYFDNLVEAAIPYTGGIDMGNNKSISMP